MSVEDYRGLHGRRPGEIERAGEHFVPDGWDFVGVGICPDCGRTIRWDEARGVWALAVDLRVLVLDDDEVEWIRSYAGEKLRININRQLEAQA